MQNNVGEVFDFCLGVEDLDFLGILNHSNADQMSLKYIAAFHIHIGQGSTEQEILFAVQTVSIPFYYISVYYCILWGRKAKPVCS